ncbi:MAG TPA: MFS transporter [Candidatus Lustribacter sp.]|jgi:DHA1 family multidrug resistance protein-like MFS transporter|nr:MFS transporter [Candidatus Lustribacter sp.]
MVCVQATMSAQNTMPAPFFPQFLEQNGVHPLSSVEFWAGAILSASALTSAVFSPVWGGVGDRIGRKKMVWRSALASAITMTLMSFCTAAWQMLALRAIAGAFAGFSTSAMALVATQVPEGRLGYALGWLSTGQVAGALIGPLIGGLLADHFHNYRGVMFYAGVFTMVFVPVCVAFTHEDRGTRTAVDRATSTIFERLRSVAQHRDFAPMFVVIMLAQICSIGLQPVLPIFVRQILGDVPWATTITGAAIAITGVAGLLSAPFLGRRSDEIGYQRVLLISLTGAACFTLPQAFVANIWAFVALRFGVGVFLGGILPTANAIIGRIATPETRGQIYGFTSTAQFLGRFVGPMLGSAIAAAFGVPAVFAFIGCLMFANLLWVWSHSRRAMLSP